MSTFQGREAENAASDYLKLQKLIIVDQNWRTRWCEIDIVAQSSEKIGLIKRAKIIHFVEVKYRASVAQGDGLEYITQKKQLQMQRAAEFWVNEHSWSGDYQLDAVAVTGYEGSWEFDYRPNITL